MRSLPHVTLQPASRAIAQRRRVQVSPTESNPVQLSQTMYKGWRQPVATRFRHAKGPNLNKDFRTTPFVIRHFPRGALCASVAKTRPVQPSVPRRSAAKAGPTESNPVKPSQTMRSLPHVTLQPSVPRRSAAKAGPTESK